MLRAKSMECISLVGMAVGKEKFRADAKQVGSYCFFFFIYFCWTPFKIDILQLQLNGSRVGGLLYIFTSSTTPVLYTKLDCLKGKLTNVVKLAIYISRSCDSTILCYPDHSAEITAKSRKSWENGEIARRRNKPIFGSHEPVFPLSQIFV